jgi:hypothetical protein
MVKISYAAILLATALPTFAQVVIQPSSDGEFDPSFGPSAGPGGECPSGLEYKGQSGVACYFVCEKKEVEDRIVRNFYFPMKNGVRCYNNGEYGKCDGKGFCVAEDKQPEPNSKRFHGPN